MGTRSPRLAESNTGRSTVLAASIPAPAISPATATHPERLERAAAFPRLALWQPDVIAVLTILLATGVAAWHRLWLQNGLAHLDIATFYLPWYAFMGEQLRQLDIPGWNPRMFSGTAFVGDPQSGWMYAPAMLFFTFFKAVRAYQLLLIFHLALAGLATYAFGRVLGLRAVAALAAAFAYEFGPLINHISCCLIHVELAAWIPVALLGVELTMRTPRWTGRAAAWSLTGFAISQMAAGWIGQGVYNGVLVVGGYVAFRALCGPVAGAVTWRARLLRMVVDGAGTMLIGVGLAAAGLLPRLDVVNRTNLAGGKYSGFEVDKYSSGWGPATFFNFMLSDDNGWRSLTFYLGAPVVALLVMAPYLARRRYQTPFFLLVTAYASIMTLHRNPLHDVVFTLFPRYESLQTHVPSRILAIQWIGPAMLAGITVELLCQAEQRERVRRAAIVGATAWGLGIVALTALGQGITLTTILFAALTCAVVAAFAAPAVWAMCAARRGRAATTRPQFLLAALLVLLIFLDPAGRGLADTLVTGRQSALLALPTGPIPRDATAVNAATTDPGGAGGFLQGLRDRGQLFRYIGFDYSLVQAGNGYPSTYREYYWLGEAQDILVNARGMMLGLDDAQGYNPMQLSNYIDAILFANHREQNYHDSQIMPTGLESPVLDMLNVRYVVIPNELAVGRPRPEVMALLQTHKEVFRNDSVRVLEDPNALPRAWIVHRAYAATDRFGLTMIDSGLVDPAQAAFLDPGVSMPPLTAPADPATEQVAITHDGADQVRLVATLATDGMVVVSATYDPDWSAYVDGRKVDLLQANGVIQGIPVPAGTHRIELVYEPRSLHAGLIVSWASLALVGAILAAFVWTRLGLPAPRRRRAPHPAANGLAAHA